MSIRTPRSFSVLFLFLCSTVAAFAQPVVSAVLNGASYSGAVAPGGWVAIYGSKLAPASALAQGLPLPAKLGGASVTVGGIAAPLLYVSPTQINALIPFEVPIPEFKWGSQTSTPVVVTSPEGSSTAFKIQLLKSAPGVFTRAGDGKGRPLLFDASYQPVETPGEGTLILYATGLGPTNPPASSDRGGASAEPLNRVTEDIEAYIGESKAKIEFAGLAPGFPGVYQLNIVPGKAASGRLFLRSGGWQSNIADIGLTEGGNVANVTGEIEVLYPAPNAARPHFSELWSSNYSQTSSALLTAAAFSVSFDILPDAKPFQVVATGEGGSAVIKFDPANGAFEALVTSPYPPTRTGDFSGSEFLPLWDLYTGRQGIYDPFPGDRIPMSRLDPDYVRVMQLIPLPNLRPGKSVNWLRSSQGTARAGSRFTLNWRDEGSIFGGFVQIPPAGPATRTTPFRLYVDGKPVASADATYKIPQ